MEKDVRTEENDEILPWVKFRKEYYLALIGLPDDEYILLSKALFSVMFEGKKPDEITFENHLLNAVFGLIIHRIDADARRYFGSQKGGIEKSKTVKKKKKILKNFNPVEFVVQKFEIDEKLALEFIGARTARNQQNDIGALEGFHKKMKGAIAASKKNAENKDVVNFYIDSGYRGFQQKYFINDEQEQEDCTKSARELKLYTRKKHIDLYVKKAMEFARKNGLPKDMEGRASLLTQEHIKDFYVKYWDIEVKNYGIDLNKLSALFNGSDLRKYLHNFLEYELLCDIT